MAAGKCAASGARSTARVTNARFESMVRRRTSDRHAALGLEVLRLREDAGISRAALASAAGVDASYLGRIEGGTERPSIETYQRLALALGADLSSHLYPNTGPAIHDRLQAPMLEGLLAERHPRWEPHLEMRVRRPSRGWIDIGLHDPRERVLLAGELQSALHRLEQLLRWQQEKAASVPSWDGWAALDQPPTVSRLLVIRRTRATREVAKAFARQLRAAYPAHPDDAIAALRGTDPWPGPALVWMLVDARGARLVGGR
jgi:transcriptional regulator with XRE-family HTH domain